MTLSEFVDIYILAKAKGERSMLLTQYKPRGWRPKGGTVKTQLGVATIKAVEDLDLFTQVIVSIELKKVAKWIKKEIKDYDRQKSSVKK